MLNTYSITSQTVSANGLLIFTNNSIATGCTAKHTAGSTTITLNKSGYYFITFNASATATGAQTSPISVQLLNGSNTVNGATASALSESASDTVSLSFSTIVAVKPSCAVVDNTASLTFQNNGVAAIFNNANVVVTKLA